MHLEETLLALSVRSTLSVTASYIDILSCFIEHFVRPSKVDYFLMTAVYVAQTTR